MARSDKRRLLLRIVGSVVTGLLWLLARTTRRRMIGRSEELAAAWRDGERVIVAFWHEGLVMMPFIYTGRRACIMVSRHPDGEMIARALQQFRIIAVRGSSTRGWVAGLKGMIRAYRAGADLAFAPDGPHGPPHLVKSGVIQMARATGARIFPIVPAASWCLRARSWDRLVIPLPGSRIVYAVGEPVTVRRDADEQEVDQLRGTLEQALDTLQTDAGRTLEARLPADPIGRATSGPV